MNEPGLGWGLWTFMDVYGGLFLERLDLFVVFCLCFIGFSEVLLARLGPEKTWGEFLLLIRDFLCSLPCFLPNQPEEMQMFTCFDISKTNILPSLNKTCVLSKCSQDKGYSKGFHDSSSCSCVWFNF